MFWFPVPSLSMWESNQCLQCLVIASMPVIGTYAQHHLSWQSSHYARNHHSVHFRIAAAHGQRPAPCRLRKSMLSSQQQSSSIVCRAFTLMASLLGPSCTSSCSVRAPSPSSSSLCDSHHTAAQLLPARVQRLSAEHQPPHGTHGLRLCPQQQLHSGVYSTLLPSLTLSRCSLCHSCSSCAK